MRWAIRGLLDGAVLSKTATYVGDPNAPLGLISCAVQTRRTRRSALHVRVPIWRADLRVGLKIVPLAHARGHDNKKGGRMAAFFHRFFAERKTSGHFQPAHRAGGTRELVRVDAHSVDHRDEHIAEVVIPVVFAIEGEVLAV